MVDRYVPFSALSKRDQEEVKLLYRNKVDYLPDSEYLYPVYRTGVLASGNRIMPPDRAVLLKQLHAVREVMDS